MSAIRDRVALVMLLSAVSALAQVRTSAILGSVSDESGGVVPDAVIEVLHVSTGETRTAVTDRRGDYRVQLLELGTYQVTAAKDGFKLSRHEGVLLELDRETVVNHVLSVGDISESVVVNGEAHIIEAAPSALTSLVASATIDELPLNGRDYIQLSVLQAGAVEARGHGRSSNHGYGLQVSISGSRPHQNNFRLDGVSLTTYNASTPGSINGLNLGVDAIQEFSVHSSNYGAQYGRASGGIVNAVTKSGGNDVHGSLFYFHRNDNLDARNFFDTGEPPEFRRHQFGSSAGGPIARNKTFFFANYEGFREERGNTTVNTTLSEAARRGDLVDGRVTVDPVMAKLAALYPLPNGEVFGDTGLFLFPNDELRDEDFATGRIDHNFGDADRLFFRYTLSDGTSDSETDLAIGYQASSTRNQSAALEETHLFSAHLLNTLRFGFLRTNTIDGATRARLADADDPDLEFVPGLGVVGSIEISGLTDFPGGTGAFSRDKHVFNSYQVSDDVYWNRGRHSVKFGGRFERIQLNTDSQSRPAGQYRFRGVDKFLTNEPDRFRAQLPGSDTIRGHRQWIGAFYTQDTYKASRRLTVDLGLRWEWTTVPTEVNGKVANLDNRTDTQMRVGDPLFDNPSFKNFAPRVGLAWDVFGTGKTQIRAGCGIFPELLLPHYLLSHGVRNPPFFLLGQTGDLETGDLPKGGFEQIVSEEEPLLRVQRIPRDLSQPYVQQWNVNVEQAIDTDTMVRIGYVGSHGLNLSSVTTDANLVEPVTLPDGRLYFPEDAERINPVFDRIRERNFNAHSFYHGLQTQFRKRMSRGVQLVASYSFAKSIDDSSLFFNLNEAASGALMPVNGQPKFNRGRSAHDIRHHAAASGTWELPFHGGRGIRRLLGGWQVSGIVKYATGLPMTPWLEYDAARTQTSESGSIAGQRPDLAPGASNNPVTGDPNGWVDASAFRRPEPGFLGNLGRGTITGPSLANVDFSVVKRIKIPRLGEQTSLDFRAEFFNLFNHTNFDLPDPERMVVFGEGYTLDDFARITSAMESREIQFGLKLRF